MLPRAVSKSLRSCTIWPRSTAAARLYPPNVVGDRIALAPPCLNGYTSSSSFALTLMRTVGFRCLMVIKKTPFESSLPPAVMRAVALPMTALCKMASRVVSA